MGRVRTRADCLCEVRPCGRVSCRWHLLWERKGVRREWRRRVRAGASDDELAEYIVEEIGRMPDTCTLDVAARGGVLYTEIAEVLGITKQRIVQLLMPAWTRLATRVARTDMDWPGPRR